MNNILAGLQNWPAMTYQSQVPDRHIPAIEQTWGPYLDALTAHADKTQFGSMQDPSSPLQSQVKAPRAIMGLQAAGR